MDQIINESIRDWGRETLHEIKSRYMQLIQSKSRSGEGLDSIRMQTHSSYGEIDRLSLRFNRYLIFVHKGAGKGRGGRKGSTWLDRHGRRRSTNPESLGKMNSGSRKEKPWLNPVLDEELPKLADVVADFRADAALKVIQIK